MEVITRQIIKMREEAEVAYDFKTYSIILEAPKESWHPNFKALMAHLAMAFCYGMPTRPTSASSEERIVCNPVPVKSVDARYRLVKMAEEADYVGSTYAQHRKVEALVFHQHEDCIAVEAPFWDDDKTCLLDVLLANPVTGFIGDWDFKPKAHQDRDAFGQVFAQKKLIQKTLLNSGIKGVDITLVEAGIFDNKNAYLLI